MRPKRFTDSVHSNDDHLKRLAKPISEAGRIAFETASQWGASISPALAEEIANKVRAHAGLPEDASEKKPVLDLNLNL
jgi:hypothetical protein